MAWLCHRSKEKSESGQNNKRELWSRERERERVQHKKTRLSTIDHWTRQQISPLTKSSFFILDTLKDNPKLTVMVGYEFVNVNHVLAQILPVMSNNSRWVSLSNRCTIFIASNHGGPVRKETAIAHNPNPLMIFCLSPFPILMIGLTSSLDNT